MAVTERTGLAPERLWAGTFGAAVALLAVGSLLLPNLVWDGFLWHYFWGPVFADANNAACAVMGSSGPELLYGRATCADAVASGAVVAEPGYTLVSEVGYAVALLFFLVGVLYLLQALDVGTDRELFFALVPFMFFGGVLRVVEDANDAALTAGIDTILSYPLNALIISPVIYFTVFFLTVAGLVATVAADRRGYVDDWGRALFGIGAVVLLATLGFLLWFVPARLADTVPGAGFYPQMSLLVLGSSVVLAYAIYEGAERFGPVINEGTGRIGLVVIFGHAVDGVANVLAADWVAELGIPVTYGAKHPVNRFIIETTASLQPESISAVVGTSWPFLVVKLVAATLVVYVFDRQIFEESPRYAILLLVAILAVGLGPGTRDMVRAAFGI
jgi:uncharacterized membrane protein